MSKTKKQKIDPASKFFWTEHGCTRGLKTLKFTCETEEKRERSTHDGGLTGQIFAVGLGVNWRGSWKGS